MSSYSEFLPQYHAYKDKVYSFLYYRLNGDRALAEDLTSDVFLKAYERFESYNPEFAFSTWIYTIARNTLIDHVRTERGTEELEEGIEVGDTQAELDRQAVDASMQMEKIEEVLSTLPSFQRECIVLKYLNGMGTKEIADITGSAEGTVRQALSRGLKALRAYTSLFFILIASLLSFLQ